ncbi:hypothetical protein OS493_021074 [Desmophyllum pertusum]|uniref:SEA domain-containing protein n=1 Tax=Desmophyllum pertusum TaxID=174260 RepID=A0A9X0A066_9CNID|nr:hypothetical protein OS493_021074 [Desmophyllum pertusum]
MFSVGASSHIISIVIMITMVVTVWTLDNWLNIKVEVTRNEMSIEWDRKLSDKKSREFKETALAVRNQLRKDLKEIQWVSDIKVKKFMQKQGKTFCEFDIQKALNMTVDIGSIAETSYARINMTLTLSSVSWIDAYNDHNSTEYKNLTTAIKAALSEIYQDADDVVGFEIASVTAAHDGSALVLEYFLLVDPDTDLKKKDLEAIFMEFTKNGSFEEMISVAEKQEQQTETEESEKTKPVAVGLIVFAAVIMCGVIITFLVVILRQNWKYIKEHSPEARFESYQKKKMADSRLLL